MITAVSAFFESCKMQEETMSPTKPTKYVLSQDVVRGLRNYLMNLDYDEAQEDFLISILFSRDIVVEIEAHYIQHLKEYLKGVTS